MAETTIFLTPRVRAADRRAASDSSCSSSGRPWRVRLWALLNAQASIRGIGGAPDDVAFVEDDRHRLARRGR
jgi:hypothetical protein